MSVLKKIVPLGLVAAMGIGLAGCNQNDRKAADKDSV